jgi:hypothetical protein
MLLVWEAGDMRRHIPATLLAVLWLSFRPNFSVFVTFPLFWFFQYFFLERVIFKCHVLYIYYWI